MIKKKKRFCYNVLYAKITKRKLMILCVVVLLVFPIIVGLIASLKLPNIINVETSAFLNYYGTAFGIFASFITYYETKRNEKKERLNSIKPILIIKTLEWRKDFLKIKIVNESDNNLRDLFLYDKYISDMLLQNKFVKESLVIIDKNVYSENIRLETNFDIVKNNKIYERDYLDYIQICCVDIDNNMWDCRFKAIIESGTINYIMINCELV